jgi:hypothetical protein
MKITNIKEARSAIGSESIGLKGAQIEAFRKYMGPSANGISDAGLRKLAGWSCFIAGWNAANKRLIK